ncbi:gp027 [Erwinia phage vB_EamP-S6]|uniref:Gp027 n=1 Tax=Erwinia phage vB_EamP-S6 TaxID=1051675 RepID=G0YQB9_9CAUD|nr:gp027 [Erwinia phage vB_EamP-S6]AEJ81546.1 gp027 [Erwinia phage vB_EamP-S6]
MSQLINKLRRAIKHHVAAQAELDWKGSRHPDDWPAIDREAARAKKRLDEVIASIQLKLEFPDS